MPTPMRPPVPAHPVPVDVGRVPPQHPFPGPARPFLPVGGPAMPMPNYGPRRPNPGLVAPMPRGGPDQMVPDGALNEEILQALLAFITRQPVRNAY